MRLSNSGLLTIDQQFLIRIDSSILTNVGTIKWVTGEIEFMSNLGEAEIHNFGIWEAQDDSEIVKTNGTFLQSIVNDVDMPNQFKGVFTITGGAPGEKTLIGTLFINNSLIKKNNRMIEFTDGIQNNGTIDP